MDVGVVDLVEFPDTVCCHVNACFDIWCTLTEQQYLGDKELAKLTHFLDSLINGHWINAYDLRSELKKAGWNNLQTYSHTLEQF